MKDDVIVYTAAFGSTVKIMPQKKFEGVKFICFSDRQRIIKGWETVIVNTQFPNDAVRNNRYYKLQPHLFFPKHEYSIYIDGNMIVLQSPVLLIKKEMCNEHMLVFDHNQTKGDARNSVYDEYEALLKFSAQEGREKDDPAIMKKQMDMFRAEGYPDNNGLVKACVLIRKHNEQDVITAMQHWWWFINNLSKRDQLSFNYVAWKNNFRFKYLQGDVRRGNNWFYMAGKGDKTLTYTLLKFWMRRLFKRQN